MMKVPVKLRKDPIVEALCEIRHEPSSSDLAPLILGALFNELKADFPRHEKLVPASMPEGLRASVPNLAFAAQYRLAGKHSLVNIGDKSLSIAVHAPYPGWDQFRALIERTLNAALSTGMIGPVKRISLRYTNRLELDSTRPLSDILRTTLSLGDDAISARPMTGPEKSVVHFRHESRKGDIVTITNLGWPANFKVAGKSLPQGLAMEIDVIADSVASASFSEDFKAILDLLHSTEKAKFFSLLTPSALETYEPEY